MAKIRKQKIVTPDPGEFSIIGIASNEKPFSVCWEINKLLDTGLTLGEPVTRLRKELNDYPSFMAFRAEDDNGNRLFLIENVTANGYFAEKWTMFRYLLIAEGQKPAETAKHIMSALKPSPMIMLCSEIVLKSKQEISFIKSYLV